MEGGGGDVSSFAAIQNLYKVCLSKLSYLVDVAFCDKIHL